MCGIAGAYQQPDGRAAVRSMIGQLAHRGPDDEGFHTFADGRVQVHLAHRRLSIIDLAHGHQPLAKDHLALSYNGELYNYRELRAELVAAGAAFVTSSDTEVVLEAWRRWGPRCLPKFRGMFAFAVLDQRTGSLFLARDHFGIKPLHFLRRKGGVVFASELKALVATFGGELRMAPEAVVASMLFYWVPDRQCVIRDVEKLQPGTWVEFRPDGSSSMGTYWDSAEVAAAASVGPQHGVDGSEADDLSRLRQVVQDSVAAHLVADVPVSSFLSGGLDSSIVTVLAKQHNPDLDAYTIAFRAQDQRLEAMPDDAAYARKVANHFGIRLHEIEINPDVVELLPRMVSVLDEPVGDPAAINTLLMCEAAGKAGVKVVLSGMGADELFGGYRKHLACSLAERYRHLPNGIRRAATASVRHLPVAARGRGIRYARWAKRFLTFAELPEEAAFRRSYSLYDPIELVALVSPDLGPYVDEVVGQHFEVYSDNYLDDHVNRMCLADSRLFLPGLNLTYTDRASMAASTEVRVPFVDPAVFRAAFALPGDRKVSGRRGKVALKEAAMAWLPKEIVHRPKASFSAPLRAWIARELRPVVDDELLRGHLVGAGVLRHEALEALVAEERAGREDRSKQIWQLLTLELWYRQVSKAGVGM